MARTEVTREQFKASKDKLSGTVKVTYIPTGAWFTSSHENIGQAGDVLENGDDYRPSEIRAMGLKVLGEQK